MILIHSFIIQFIFIGAKVNALDGLGQTALHRCARRDAAAACRLLLAHRADPQLISLQGYTALQLAGDSAAPILQGKVIYRFIHIKFVCII